MSLRSKLEALRRRGPPAEILSEAKDLVYVLLLVHSRSALRLATDYG